MDFEELRSRLTNAIEEPRNYTIIGVATLASWFWLSWVILERINPRLGVLTHAMLVVTLLVTIAFVLAGALLLSRKFPKLATAVDWIYTLVVLLTTYMLVGWIVYILVTLLQSLNGVLIELLIWVITWTGKIVHYVILGLGILLGVFLAMLLVSVLPNAKEFITRQLRE